jgi:oxalate---CoA ligase
VLTPEGPETAVLMLCVMAGFSCVFINPRFTGDEYTRYFSKLRVDAIIIQAGDNTPARCAAEAQNLPVIEMIRQMEHGRIFSLVPEPLPGGEPRFAGPNDIALILLTSGTTEMPKIVPLSQRLICTAVKKAAAANRYTAAERCLLITPLHHVLANSNLLQVISLGGTVICTRDFITSDIVPLLEDFRPSCYPATPALHRAILQELKKIPRGELKTHSLRIIKSASAALPGPVRDELEQVLGVPLVETYGMSEVGGGTIATNFPPSKRGSAGKPVIEHLAIMDDKGTILEPPEVGEIVVKGDEVFTGYEGAVEENAIVFTNGWFRTGDTGYLDNEGFLWLTGRKKELINKGGEKIAPAEIDAVLMEHPLVKDAMSFKIPDPLLGEDIAAMVVPSSGAVTVQDLRMFLVDRLIPFKIPGKIYFVDAIPRNANGKPLRHIGTEQYGRPIQADNPG